MPYYKLTQDGYSVGSKPRDGFTAYDTNNPPQELQTLFDADNLTKLIQDGEALVTAYIQAEVDKFNEDNGTKFTNIHAMANYKDSTTYPHAAACKARWDWNELVWTEARTIQQEAIENNWDANTFISKLTPFGI